MKVKCQVYTILTTMHLTISDGVTHFVLHYIQLFLRKNCMQKFTVIMGAFIIYICAQFYFIFEKDINNILFDITFFLRNIYIYIYF